MRRITRTNAGFVSVNTETLQRLREDIAKNGNARVHVGILEGHDPRLPKEEKAAPVEDFPAAPGTARAVRPPKPPIGNAGLAAVHEFGVLSKNIPARSFLIVPVINHLPEALKITDRNLWHKVILKGGILQALGLLGAYALDVIHLAFDTGGFGAWAALKARTIKRKGSAAILIDTAQMRQAVTAEVFDK